MTNTPPRSLPAPTDPDDLLRQLTLARERASRLQRLQEVGAILSRSLDEVEIVHELARQVRVMVRYDGIVITYPDIERGTVVTALRMVRGVTRPRATTRLGSGPLGEAARTGRPVRIARYDGMDNVLPPRDDLVGDGGPAGSVLAVPMKLGTHLIGVIGLHADDAEAFTADDEEVLEMIGTQAATAIANARLYAESQRERRQSEALADISRAVSRSLNPEEVLQLILRHAMGMLHTQGACIGLRNGPAELRLVAGVGVGEELLGRSLPMEGSLSGGVVRSRRPRIVNDVASEPQAYRAVQHHTEIEKLILVPLVTGDEAIGFVAVLNRSADFSDDDASILQRFADQVVVALVNARLFEDVRKATREWTIAFDAIASGMVVLDTAGTIRRCNASAARLAGVESFGQLLGQPFHTAVLGLEQDSPQSAHRQAMEEKRTVREIQRVTERGRIYAILASPHPDGGAVVTFEDVTAHHSLAERHRLVVETTSDAIVITDRQRRLIFANPAASELLGRDGSLIGMAVRDVVPEDHWTAIQEHQTQAFAGTPQRYETEIVRPDGERRLVSVSTAPLREVGEITGIVASIRDITVERRARDAVMQSEARYRNLFESATDAIYTLDANGAFTSVNAATCAVAGYGRDELLGRSAAPMIRRDERADVWEHFRRALIGESRRYECHFRRRSGGYALLSVTNTPIRRGDRIVGILGVARDVTEERRAAEALARSDARYTRLVDSASDAIFTVDASGVFTSVNRALELSVGRARGELLGRKVTEIVDPADRDGCWQVFTQTMAGQRARAEFRYPHTSGELRYGSIVTTPIADGEGGIVTGALGVVRDITDERRLAEQLLQQEKLAAIGQLVSGVAHELNNPLAGVMAFSQLLLMSGSPNPDQRGSLESIYAEAKRAAKIVSNLLTFARQHPPERRATDLNQVLLDTIELRRYALRVHQIELDVALDPDLPVTWADKFQLQQVFLNLLSNAEQAVMAWPGPKRVSVRSEKVDGSLRVTVSDTGPGIEGDKVDQIFNPFFTTRPVGQGTGLGLSISHGIVKDHGGRISVSSQEGKGATFTIDLPWVPATETGVAAAKSRRSAVGNRTVLIVDDEPAIRQVLSAFLSAAGHMVEAVGSGGEGIERLRRRRYDAILLDLRMPDMPGDAVYAEVASRDPEQAARIVFLTGDVQNEYASEFVKASGRPCLSKPFELEEVASVLFAGLAS